MRPSLQNLLLIFSACAVVLTGCGTSYLNPAREDFDALVFDPEPVSPPTSRAYGSGRTVDYDEVGGGLHVGVPMPEGYDVPTAVNDVITQLRARGYEVVEFNCPGDVRSNTQKHRFTQVQMNTPGDNRYVLLSGIQGGEDIGPGIDGNPRVTPPALGFVFSVDDEAIPPNPNPEPVLDRCLTP